MTPPPFLPYGRQELNDEDIAAVVATLKGEYLTTGPATDDFEQAFADATGAKHAISCSSGTAALHLAAWSLELAPHQAVVVPALTFLATASAPHLTGATVVFADVDAATGLMNATTLAGAVARTQAAGLEVGAVFPVHLNGRCADVPALRAALGDGVPIVEDACHAVGGQYLSGAPVGCCESSDMATFSMHPVKSFTSAEGGMITCNDDKVAAVLKRRRNHGMTRDPRDFLDARQAFADEGEPNPWYYEMHEPGLNYRLTDVACALGRSQLRRLPVFIEKRRTLVDCYRHALSRRLPEVGFIEDGPQTRIGWHLFVALIDFDHHSVSRAAVMRGLRKQGVGSQVHYLPVHRQPFYRRVYPDLDLPGADRYYDRCLSLPLYPTMTTEDVERVVSALAHALKRNDVQ